MEDKYWVSPYMMAYYVENHPPQGEEYIRKEALLEWAKKELQTNTWYYESHKKPNDLHYGRIEAFKQLIDKLESL